MDVKSKKFNILACCAAGNGCCQLVSLKVKRVFTKLGLKCNVEANTVSAVSYTHLVSRREKRCGKPPQSVHGQEKARTQGLGRKKRLFPTEGERGRVFPLALSTSAQKAVEMWKKQTSASIRTGR